MGNKQRYIAVMLVLGISMIGKAQSLLHNNFNISHQSALVNPAYEPDAKWEFALPTNFYLRTGNTDVRMEDLFAKGSDFGQNLSDIALRLDGSESIFLNYMMEGLYVGLKMKGIYISAGAYLSADIRLNGFSAPLKLITQGNGAYIEEDLDLSPFGASVLNTVVYHAGVSMDAPFMENLRIGARLKYISGVHHAEMKENTTTLRTDPDTYYLTINSDLIARTAGIDSNSGSILSQFLGADNRGLGIDLGATYRWKDKWTFNANINDLGFIKWRNGVIYENDNATFTHEGQFYDIEGDNEFDFKEMLDSLKDAILPNRRTEAYTSSLYTRFSLGAKYQLTERIAVDGLLTGRINGGTFQPALYLGGTYALYRGLQFRATYYAMPNYYLNWNAGFGVNLLFAQMYCVLDNGTALLNAPRARNVGVQFGLSFGNFRTSAKKTKAPKAKKDKGGGGLFKKKPAKP